MDRFDATETRARRTDAAAIGRFDPSNISPTT
jgi:hypothetical protein